jgi:hypothetical protein
MGFMVAAMLMVAVVVILVLVLMVLVAFSQTIPWQLGT